MEIINKLITEWLEVLGTMPGRTREVLPRQPSQILGMRHEVT